MSARAMRRLAAMPTLDISASTGICGRSFACEVRITGSIREFDRTILRSVLDDHPALRRTSKAIFGNSHRLELLAAIAAIPETFIARDLADQLGIADNLVTSQLARL